MFAGVAVLAYLGEDFLNDDELVRHKREVDRKFVGSGVALDIQLCAIEGEQVPQYRVILVVHFDQLFGWFEAGGDAAVARWLTERDIAHFSPKAQPPRTAGWEAVANTWSEPEDAFDAALTAMGRPDVFFGLELAETHAFDGAEDIAGLLKSPRKCGFRLQRAGYVALACPGADRWSFAGPARRVQARLAFARQTLDRATAVKMLRERGRALACGENIATPANE